MRIQIRRGHGRSGRSLGQASLPGPARVGADGHNSLAASVVIPSWNGARFLPTCLDALRRQSLECFETIVVDSGSTDETEEVLASYPEVRLVTLPVNRGFAVAVNRGLVIARGCVIVLLNNDTEAETGWLEALVDAVQQEPRIGMATSKVRLFDRREVLHTTGDIVDISGVARNRGVWEKDRGQWDEELEVFGASGAAAAYKRELFETVGSFEESFGSYLEDVDLAWRARLAGWRSVFAPRAVVYHRLSATGGGPTASFLVGRNRVWLIARNYPLRLLARHWREVLGAIISDLLKAARSWRGKEARATIAGVAVGLLTWPRMIPARRRIQSMRTVDDDELERLLGGGSGD